MNEEPQTLRLEAEAAKLEIRSAAIEAKATAKGTDATTSRAQDLNKESYTVITPFRSVHDYDQEYTTGDQFTDTADKERLLKLLTSGFIK